MRQSQNVRTVASLAFVLAMGGSVSAFAVGCGADEALRDAASSADLSSARAAAAELQFEGEVLIPTVHTEAERVGYVREQLQWLNGMLHDGMWSGAAAGLAQVEILSDAPETDAKLRLRYRAHVPLAWGNSVERPVRNQAFPFPDSFSVVLPLDMTELGIGKFVKEHMPLCLEADHGRQSWWYFNPTHTGCTPRAGLAFVGEATVTSLPQPQGESLPDYDRIWADGELRVVIWAGVAEEAKAPAHPLPVLGGGVQSFEDLQVRLRRSLRNDRLRALDATAEWWRGYELSGNVRGDKKKKVNVWAMMARSPHQLTQPVDPRFVEAAKQADYVVWSGHSGLGLNLQAFLAALPQTPGHYQIVHLDGCGGIGAVGTEVFSRQGQGSLGQGMTDVLTNTTSDYFHLMDDGLAAVIQGLSSPERPSYEDILWSIPRQGGAVVLGDEDNPRRMP